MEEKKKSRTVQRGASNARAGEKVSCIPTVVEVALIEKVKFQQRADGSEGVN